MVATKRHQKHITVECYGLQRQELCLTVFSLNSYPACRSLRLIRVPTCAHSTTLRRKLPHSESAPSRRGSWQTCRRKLRRPGTSRTVKSRVNWELMSPPCSSLSLTWPTRL